MSETADAKTRKRLAISAVVIVAALLFLVLQGLSDSTVYFRTADQAVENKDELGNRRFRIEGTVKDGTVEETGNAVNFAIENKGVVVPVVHKGDPPELFRPGIPVVLEGRFQGDEFSSDRIMVRHSSTYQEKNPERVDTYVGKDGAD